MSAEILRRAAEQMRSDAERCGDKPSDLFPVVADLLDEAAEWGECEGCGHSQQRCDEWATRPNAIKCCPDCKHAPRALAVARAYLATP